jgi:hypothetical protein
MSAQRLARMSENIPAMFWYLPVKSTKQFAWRTRSIQVGKSHRSPRRIRRVIRVFVGQVPGGVRAFAGKYLTQYWRMTAQ